MAQAATAQNRKSDDADPVRGMPHQFQNLPDFRISRPDTIQFATLDGLSRASGEPSERLRRLALKELADNSLDAADAVGKPGEVSIFKIDTNTYRVVDPGAGIPGDLADLFSIHRPMQSGKFLRRPERGALGNGLRICVGVVVATGGTIEVNTRGQALRLRPRRIGPTEIISSRDAPDIIGTEIVVRFGPDLPEDDDDLSWAVLAIQVSRAKSVPYSRRPSAKWMDGDAFTELLMTIEPDTTTVRQIVEMFDGCTGATAGRLAAPFGKNRAARDLTDAEAVQLLRCMQRVAREVKPAALSPVGPARFYDEGYEYARATGTFQWGAHEPKATIPYVAEVWAMATSKKGKGVTFEEVYANRTAICGDDVESRRSDYSPRSLRVAGCGLYLDIGGFEDGDVHFKMHIVSPFVPILSLGKRPNFGPMRDGISEALRKAHTKSRAGLPPDPPGEKTEPPPKQPRQPKPSKPPKPPVVVHVPTTVLGRMIADAARAEQVKVEALLVMSDGHDPFGMDNARCHKIAKWFSDILDSEIEPDNEHYREIHYVLSRSGKIRRPDGRLYLNNESCWDFIQKAGRIARWLDYTDFERIKDHRNAAPLWFAGHGQEESASTVKRTLAVLEEIYPSDIPPLHELLPRLGVEGEAKLPCQRFRLCVVGEKSSLARVLRPIVVHYSMDAVFDTGDASDSHIYELVKRAARDTRPCVVFYCSDYDPSGFNMPTAAARKVQALHARHFPELDLRLHQVALTHEQCEQFNLPGPPMKATEKRAKAWRATTGRGQTEIDSLISLHRGALETILRAAIAPYFDETLAQRFDAAKAVQPDVHDWFASLPERKAAAEEIAPLRSTAVEAIEALTDAMRSHTGKVAKAVRDAPDRPDLDAIDIKPELTGDPPPPLFHTTEDFVAATRRLIARRDSKRLPRGAKVTP